MSPKHPLLLAGLVLFTACAKDASQPTMSPSNDASKTPAQTPAQPPAKPMAQAPAQTPAQTPAEAPAKTPAAPAAADMDAAIQTLMAKPELADQSIEVQHILIGFKGAPRMRLTRSKEEAKVRAQEVWAEVMGGADFDAAVKKYTDDSHPGIYPMTKAGRAGMVKGFGDVGFRLKVGEIGVAPWEAQASPFGWHIIKRVK